MRFYTLGLLVLLGCGTPPASKVDGTLKGMVDGNPVSLSFSLGDRGEGCFAGTGSTVGVDLGKDEAKLLLTMSAVDSTLSSVNWPGATPWGIETFLGNFGPPPFAAGTVLMQGADTGIKVLDKDLNELFLIEDVQFTLESVSLDQGDVLLEGPFRGQASDLKGTLTMEARAALRVNGKHHPYFRIAGQTFTDARFVQYRDKGFLKERNDCPGELTNPFVNATKMYFSNAKLTIDDWVFDCTGENGGLCLAKREGVVSGGCTWKVAVLTDGSFQQLAVAGWANDGCQQKTCNAWR